MSVAPELRDALDEVASTARVDRVPNWSANIGITVANEPWVTCRTSPDGVAVVDGVALVDTTLFAADADAVRRWLVDCVDYTHIVRSGDMVIEGSYFDVLLLSKALGLRPDRKEIVT